MTIDDNNRLVRRYIEEVVNAGRVDAMADYSVRFVRLRFASMRGGGR